MRLAEWIQMEIQEFDLTITNMLFQQTNYDKTT